MEIVDCVQGTEEWYLARMGIPTASEFDKVLQTVGPKGGIPRGRQTYLRKLAGELVTGEPMQSFTNWAMERGKQWEPEARALYELIVSAEVKQVGFVRNDITGCSPDALVGDDGVLEIKTAEPHILIELFENGTFPTEHYAQCQGALWITGRQWCDLIVYARKMPLFVQRTERDEPYITKLAGAVARFHHELQALVTEIKRW